MPRRPSTHVDDPRAVGERIRQARLRAGLKQRDLVFEGCTAGFLSRIEAGERIPSLQVLRELAQRLGVTADYLATGELVAQEDDLLAAELAARSGDREGAARIYRRKLRDSEPTRSRARLGLGRLALEAGEHAEAIKQIEQALGAGSLSSSDARIAREQLGRAYAMLARFDEALAVFEALFSEANAAGDKAGLIRSSVYLANTHIDRGEPRRAEEVIAAVIEDAKASADPVTLSNLFWSQSRLHASEQRFDLAAEYAQMAHATLAATEHTLFAARALLLRAQMENDRENASEALELSDAAYSAIAPSGNRYDLGLTLLEKARSLAKLGDVEQAASIALGATAMFQDSHPASAGRAYSIAARVFSEMGEADKALELYELAIETLPTADRHAAEAHRRMAEIYERQGREAAALAHLKRALDIQGVGVS